MSMPNFPEGALDITCEQAFNMLLGSIAMEELALSHIMNAEGEKLQYVLGTIPGKPRPCSTSREVLEVNRSISDLLEKVAYNQLLLKGKLQQVLEARDTCAPPVPPCPPLSSSTCVFLADKAGCWARSRPLSWNKTGKNEEGVCWQGCSSSLIHLCPQTTYLFCCSFRLCPVSAGPVCAVLQSVQNCACEDIAVFEACADCAGSAVFISGSTVLTSEIMRPAPPAIQVVLKTPDAVTVERGVLSLTVF